MRFKRLIDRSAFAYVATVTYALGTLIHLARCVTRFQLEEMSVAVHAVITVLAGYGGLGFLAYFRDVKFVSLLDRIVYGLITFHLTVSAIMHAYSLVTADEDWLIVFPLWYSYVAVLYFAGFGYYSLRLAIRQGRTLRHNRAERSRSRRRREY